MKKWLLFFLVFALVVYVLFLSYLYTYRAEFASTYLSRSFNVHANVEKMDLFSDAIIFKNVTLSSPYGYSSKEAFFAKEVVVKMTLTEQLATFFSYRDAAISKITINNCFLHIEKLSASSDDSNWQNMLTSAQERYKYNPGTRKFLVGAVLVHNLQASFKADVTQSKFTKFKPITLIQIDDLKKQKEPHTGLYILLTAGEKLIEEIEKRTELK